MHKIRKSLTSEAELISELAIRSKAHWGYDDEFMRSCREELSHTPKQLEDRCCRYFVAEVNKKVVGFYKLADTDQETIALEALFVEPSAIGQGLGKVLLEHAKRTAKKLGGRYLEAQSDPYAEPFYRAMGATVIGRAESGSIPGRYLPQVQMAL